MSALALRMWGLEYKISELYELYTQACLNTCRRGCINDDNILPVQGEGELSAFLAFCFAWMPSKRKPSLLMLRRQRLFLVAHSRLNVIARTYLCLRCVRIGLSA